jgi:hypothetical protein
MPMLPTWLLCIGIKFMLRLCEGTLLWKYLSKVGLEGTQGIVSDPEDALESSPTIS